MMINKIQGIRPQDATQGAGAVRVVKKDTQAPGMMENKDVYVSDTGKTDVQEEPRVRKNLTSQMAAALAQKYDVKNMTRDEYGSLLQELRDSGIISSKEFGTGFGGEVPYTAPEGVQMTMGPADGADLDAWPSGKERADFTKLLYACAQYCSSFPCMDEDGREKELCGSMADSYRRLYGIFKQIERA